MSTSSTYVLQSSDEDFDKKFKKYESTLSAAYQQGIRCSKTKYESVTYNAVGEESVSTMYRYTFDAFVPPSSITAPAPGSPESYFGRTFLECKYGETVVRKTPKWGYSTWTYFTFPHDTSSIDETNYYERYRFSIDPGEMWFWDSNENDFVKELIDVSVPKQTYSGVIPSGIVKTNTTKPIYEVVTGISGAKYVVLYVGAGSYASGTGDNMNYFVPGRIFIYYKLTEMEMMSHGG